MNTVRGPHTYNVYYSDTYEIKVYIFGEKHIKETIDIPSITFADLVKTALNTYKIGLYLELPDVNSIECRTRKPCETDMIDIYNTLTLTSTGNLNIYLADLRETEGRNLFNNIIFVLGKTYMAELKDPVTPAVITLLGEMYRIIKSMRLDFLGNDDSFDFLIFQGDNDDEIDNLLDLIDDLLYITISQSFNKRLAQIGITKQYFLETIETILENPSESDELFNDLIVMFIKWQSIVMDIYIIASMFSSDDKNILLYTGAFHSESISIVLDAIGFELLESYTNNKDYIKIDNLSF